MNVMLRALASTSTTKSHQLLAAVTPLCFESKRFFPKRGTKPPPDLIFDFAALEKMTGGKYTHKPLDVPRLGGRDPVTKRKVNARRAGGVKFHYFMIDTVREGPSEPGEFYEERVLEVRRDPNRTPFIALVAGTKGKRWILATENMEAGQIIKTTQHIPQMHVKPIEGNAYPLGALPVNTIVNCIEKSPGTGAAFAIAAGGAATVTRHDPGRVVLTMANKYSFSFLAECMATVGRLSNKNWKDMDWGSMNMKRRFGIKQHSGLWHRRDGYQGRKCRPIPPTKEAVIDPQPDELLQFTLEVEQLSGLFGVAKHDPIRINSAWVPRHLDYYKEK